MLRESEERLKRSQEIAHLGSWELDLIHDRLTWSDEVYRIFGLKPQEFGATNEAFLARVHPEDRAAVDAAYTASVCENRDTYEMEHRVVRTLDAARFVSSTRNANISGTRRAGSCAPSAWSTTSPSAGGRWSNCASSIVRSGRWATAVTP